jgi:hypothetical protein
MCQTIPLPKHDVHSRLQCENGNLDLTAILGYYYAVGLSVPVAQLDSASASEAEGYRFESRRGRLRKCLMLNILWTSLYEAINAVKEAQ